MSRETYSLTISKEKGYQPSIAAHLSNNGQKFEIGLSARILAKQKFEANLSELSEIRSEYHLDPGCGNASMRSSGLWIYAKVAIRQIPELTSEFGQQINAHNKPFYDECLSKERALLRELGL